MWRPETNADRKAASAAASAAHISANSRSYATPFRSQGPPKTSQQIRDELEDDRAYKQSVADFEDHIKQEAVDKRAWWKSKVANLATAQTTNATNVYNKGVYLRIAGSGVFAAKHLWISLILGSGELAAAALYEMVVAGENGVAQHRCLAGILLMVLGSLQQRAIEEKRATYALGRSLVEKPNVRSASAVADVIAGAARTGVRDFGRFGCSEELAMEHLVRVDEEIASAVRNSGDYYFPIGLDRVGAPAEWSVLDFLEMPEALPDWEHGTSCDHCGEGFSLFKRRHHCRNCGKSVCGTHSDGFFSSLYGGRQIKKGTEHKWGEKKGMARVCDSCNNLIMGFDDEGVLRKKERPGLPDLGLWCKSTGVSITSYY